MTKETDKDKALAALTRGRTTQQRGDNTSLEDAELEDASKHASLQASKQNKPKSDLEDPLKPFSSYLPASLQKKLKLFALENDTTVTTVLEEAIKAHIEK
jgi:type IV secretory pathway VirB10-like protein